MSRQCVSKWARRYREEGRAGLEDRSSRPRCSPTRTSPAVEEQVLRARRALRARPSRLLVFTGVPERTISRILRRHGVLRIWDQMTGNRSFTARALNNFHQKGITHIAEIYHNNHRPRYSLGGKPPTSGL